MPETNWQLETPVAVIIFNRPHLAQRLYDVLQQVRPRQLFVIADGARENKLGEAELCAATRAIFDKVDWDCDVQRNYSATNLGCGMRPATGISWVFEQVPEAIILEDDCLPHPSFFRYCTELLERYRDDTRVAHIGGTNFHSHLNTTNEDYLFTRYPLCWGWASWRRAWKYFDYELKDWASMLASGELEHCLACWFEKPSERNFWLERFRAVQAGDKSHIWDYQWILSCWRQQALSVCPSVNLVSNVGFGNDGTHTLLSSGTLIPVYERFGVKSSSWIGKTLASTYDSLFPQRFANLPVQEMAFPLQHPTSINRALLMDSVLQKQNYEGGWRGKIKRILKQQLLGKH